MFLAESVDQGDHSEIDDELIQGEGYGLGPALSAAGLGPPTPELPEQLSGLRPKWEKAEIITETARFLESVEFTPRGEQVIPQHDRIPFYKRVSEGIENYAAKHRRNREKGSDEAAQFGTAKFGEQNAVVFAMDFSFMGGSLATVPGERFLQALELAERRDEPLVAVYESGGARQDENVRALYQMERVVAGIEELRRRNPNVPIISVAMAEMWGGMTASSMPRGDYRIALTGTRMGFAGTRVIEASEGRKIDPNAQRAEAHALWRHVDYMVDDVDELRGHISRLFEVTKKPNNDFEKDLVSPAKLAGPGTGERFFEFSDQTIDDPHRPPAVGSSAVRFSAELRSESDYDELVQKHTKQGLEEDQAHSEALGTILDERYRNLLYDTARPDTEMITKIAFTDVVALYNRFFDVERDIYFYPSIVASIGKIGNQPFLVIGDQPSYDVSSGEVRKVLSTPRPVDMRYMKRAISMGARFDLPLILLTDTPGAEASLVAEQEGQFDYIADILSKYPDYPQPIISVIHGLQGSGGGLITSPRGDSIAMTSKGLMSVAEPGAASVIIYGEGATPDDRKHTLLAFGPDAETQLADGMIDYIIDESDNPYETAVRIQKAIIETFGELSTIGGKKLRERRWDRLRNGEPFKIDPASVEDA